MALKAFLSDEEIRSESDIILKIDQDADVGSAARFFEIAVELIHALEDIDRVVS